VLLTKWVALLPVRSDSVAALEATLPPTVDTITVYVPKLADCTFISVNVDVEEPEIPFPSVSAVPLKAH
jgi:hypothetical protein